MKLVTNLLVEGKKVNLHRHIIVFITLRWLRDLHDLDLQSWLLGTQVFRINLSFMSVLRRDLSQAPSQLGHIKSKESGF